MDKRRITIVTGGNGLLGKEIIFELSSRGYFCINVDITHETSEDLSTVNCDITNPKSIDKCLNLLIKKYKKIDGLVNNAYPKTSDWGKKFNEIKYSSWQKNIDFQLNSHFYFTQQVSKHMINRKQGSIINIASIYGMVGPDFSIYEGTEMTMPAAYSAIKGGIINFTRYLSSYLGKHNIRVNAVSPGGILNNQPLSFIENYNKKVPLGRMAFPKDISPLISFLLSDNAEYITGQNIAVDGGLTSI